MNNLSSMAEAARAAARVLACASTEKKNRGLAEMARALRANAAKILKANKAEVAAAKDERTKAFVDRLTLDEARLEKVAAALEHIAKLPDPVGKVTKYAVRPNGLVISRMRVPLGVIAILYEARPGVTADAAGLCIKSGNAVILRGGKEAVRTNAAIAAALQEGLKSAGLPPGSVGFVDDPDRAAVKTLLTMDTLIDLVIPRGGPELTGMVRKESSIPVLAHEKGVCHVYVDEGADLKMAEDIAFNAKAERPGVCNAMETLLVHKSAASAFLPDMAARYRAAGVEVRGCPRTLRLVKGAKAAVDEDWDTEYLDLIVAVKVVDSFDEALDHIARHGTKLAAAVVTSDKARGERFLREVEAGAVYWNASTRFTDGGEFGMGAEMGISTQKIHAWGPVGLVGITTEKFVVEGTGQVRDSRKSSDS